MKVTIGRQRIRTIEMLQEVRVSGGDRERRRRRTSSCSWSSRGLSQRTRGQSLISLAAHSQTSTDRLESRAGSQRGEVSIATSVPVRTRRRWVVVITSEGLPGRWYGTGAANEPILTLCASDEQTGPVPGKTERYVSPRGLVQSAVYLRPLDRNLTRPFQRWPGGSPAPHEHSQSSSTPPATLDPTPCCPPFPLPQHLPPLGLATLPLRTSLASTSPPTSPTRPMRISRGPRPTSSSTARSASTRSARGSRGRERASRVSSASSRVLRRGSRIVAVNGAGARASGGSSSGMNVRVPYGEPPLPPPRPRMAH